MVSISFFDTEGFDTEAHEIIEYRRAAIRELIHQAGDGQRGDEMFSMGNQLLGGRTIQQLVSSIEDESYLRLAHILNITESVRMVQVRRFWRVGMFDQTAQHPNGKEFAYERPGLEETYSAISTILIASPYVINWIAALKQQGLCRDVKAAEHVAYKLSQINRMAIGQARDIVRAWSDFGNVGLLKYSEYPSTTELLMLQQRVGSLGKGWAETEAVLAVVRADLISVWKVFHQPEHVMAYQHMHGHKSQLWDQSILHQPLYAVQRQQYHERLTSLLSALASGVAYQRGCDNETARVLVDIILTKGLDGLIAWRSNNGLIQEHDDRKRIERVAQPIIQSLSIPARTLISQRLIHLHESIRVTAAPFVLFRLIRERPSSLYRRRCQRVKLPEALIADFANRVGIKQGEARACIKNVMIYGPLGIVPQREWEAAIDPRIWSYLAMFKLGRLEGTVDLDSLTRCVSSYAVSLGLQALHRQIVVGVFKHFAKPRYYNSGDGPAVAVVPLRKALKLAGVARLHEQWLLIPIELDIQLTNMGMQPIGKSCHLLLVFARGSQCPLGFCLTPAAPTRVEAGLALYQSIFHPSVLHWPLRGLPEQVVIPAELTKGGIEDLARAAQFMMAQVTIADDLKPHLAPLVQVRQIIAELKEIYTPERMSSRQRAPKQQMTIQQTEQQIGTWLYQRCFEKHRQEPVPRRLRQYGVALPGYDTPAAGWLLPVIDELLTKRDGVMLSQRFYANSMCGIEPGVAVRVRSLKSSKYVARAVFIEYGSEHILHYLPLQRTSKGER